MSLKNSPWLQVLQPIATPKARLFCVPYAGGAATAFATWQDSLPEGIEVVGIQLPGRGARMAEDNLSSLFDVVSHLLTAITPYINDCPYFIYGHSMGARVAYELTSELDKQSAALPKELFVSGARSPQIPSRKKPIHDLPHDAFIKEIEELNGTPKALLENKDLMELALPILRADFKICETWKHEIGHKLHIPLRTLGGLDDPGVLLADLDAWKECTDGLFKRHVFPGDHFFINPQQDKMLALIGRYMMSAI